MTVNYFYGHLKTVGTKKYHVSKLPMRKKKKSEHCSFFCFNSTAILALAALADHVKKSPDITSSGIILKF